MGFTEIVNLVDHEELNVAQRSKLRTVLQDRQKKLAKALADVELALKKLGGRKSSKRKTGKRKR